MSQHLTLYDAQTLNQARLKNLWSISLAYCQIGDLSPLSNYIALGFVDLSFTDINPKMLQTTFKDMNIIKMNIFGCKALETSKPNVGRGFLIHVLPHLWVLNGLYIHWIERNQWHHYFTHESRGIYSSLCRKWKIDENITFTPTYILDGTAVKSKIRTIQADSWIKNCPTSFHMAADYDSWKLGKLAQEWEDKGRFSTLFIACQKKDGIKDQDRMLFMLLIAASLFDDIPIPLLQAVMKATFKEEWTQETSSPLFWNPKDKMLFLGLLTGRILIDMNSPIYMNPIGLLPGLIQDFQSVLQALIKACYPLDDTEAIKLDFDFVKWSAPSTIGSSHTFRSYLTPTDMMTLSKFFLIILDLLCLCPFDQLFDHEFPSMAKLLDTCLIILTRPAFKQEINHLLFNQELENRNASQLGAAVLELKLRLHMIIQKIQQEMDQQGLVDDHEPSIQVVGNRALKI